MRFFLSLGSNVGAREEALAGALARLGEAGLAIDTASSIYETSPVGEAAGPGWFLNMVVSGESALAPGEILARCLAIERAMGRERIVRGGPRAIDIDLLLAGDAVLDSDECSVPHRRMHERRFVLEPLAEIAPDLVHPVLGRTISELLRAQKDPAPVRRIAGSLSSLSPATDGARLRGTP